MPMLVSMILYRKFFNDEIRCSVFINSVGSYQDTFLSCVRRNCIDDAVIVGARHSFEAVIFIHLEFMRMGVLRVVRNDTILFKIEVESIASLPQSFDSCYQVTVVFHGSEAG